MAKLGILLSEDDYVWHSKSEDTRHTHRMVKVITNWEQLQVLARPVRKNTILWNGILLFANLFYFFGFLFWLKIGEFHGVFSFGMTFVVAFVIWMYM